MCHPRWVLDGVGVKAGVIDWLIPSSNIMQMKVTGVCVCVCVIPTNVLWPAIICILIVAIVMLPLYRDYEGPALHRVEWENGALPCHGEKNKLSQKYIRLDKVLSSRNLHP